MPDASAVSLAYHRLDKAEDRYTAAKSLLNDGLYLDSINRFYYAIFHGIRGICALDGVDYRDHSEVISYFQHHYITTGIFPKDFLNKVQDAFIISQNCDCEDFFAVSKQDVIEQMDHARILIDRFRAFVNNRES